MFGGLEMKKVLILAYDFPPYVSVGGLRPYSWYKYLKEYNVHPVVVTRQWENTFGNHLDYISASRSMKTIFEENEFGTLIKTAYKPNLSNKLLLKHGSGNFKIIRKINTLFYEFFQWLFLCGPKSNLYFAANDYLKSNHVDLIIASGDPFILFRYASLLSIRYNLPWIADYRDPWSQDMNLHKKIFLKFLYRHFEQKIVSNASLITTVSEFVVNQISELIENKKIEVLPNGFDSETINKTKAISQQSNFLTISIAGSIFIWHPIERFLCTLSEYLLENNEARITLKFYGLNIEGRIRNLISNKYKNLENNTFFTNKIPYHELLENLARDNVMLLFNYYSYMGTKIYDYIGLKRLIILCFSDDQEALLLKNKYFNIVESNNHSNQLQSDLIKETNSGIIIKDSNHLKVVLNELLIEYSTSGKISCNSINVDEYSRQHQVKNLAEIIHKTV